MVPFRPLEVSRLYNPDCCPSNIPLNTTHDASRKSEIHRLQMSNGKKCVIPCVSFPFFSLLLCDIILKYFHLPSVIPFITYTLVNS